MTDEQSREPDLLAEGPKPKKAKWTERLGRKTPLWASRGELGPWEQKEVLLARIAELEPILNAVNKRAELDEERSDVASVYAEKAQAELREAKDVLTHDPHPLMRRAAHLGVAQSHVDAALNLLVWLASPADVKAMLPQMVALVKEHFATADPLRVRVVEIARELQGQENGHSLDPSDRAFLAETVSLARRLIRKETLRVRSFVRIVAVVTMCLLVAAIAVAVLGFNWPKMVPLCFVPEANGTFQVVCPTWSRDFPNQPDTRQIADTAQAQDYLVIEIVGVASAAIASAAALRRIRGTALPYNVPVVLATLKLPTGALTAVLGLLLMRGGFIPGLSALDSTAQIIAWAIVFGYSQQLFTKFVDNQGQALLDAVRGPNSFAPPPGGTTP